MESNKPANCTCDPRDWSATIIPDACKKFVNPSNVDFCTVCFHGKDCHESTYPDLSTE